MPRPRCPRQICVRPGAVYYKPAGIPLRAMSEVVLAADEAEALRLADLEGLYQDEAAENGRCPDSRESTAARTAAKRRRRMR